MPRLSHRHPKNSCNNIKTLLLRALILETPRPILLIVPIRARRRMQSPPSNLVVRLLGLILHTHAVHTASGRILRGCCCGVGGSWFKGRGRRGVLDYGACDNEFVGCGLFD